MSQRTLTQRIDLGDAAPDGVRGPPGPRPRQGLGLRRAWSSASRTCPGRCGCGTATATAGPSARSSPSRPSRPTPSLLPPALKPFGAVPPLISDIDLSVDDRWLYVSCWGTGELKQYDVSDIFHPRETGSVKLGGIVRPPAPPRRARPAARRRPADGRGQPRRPAGVRHQLAVRGLGRHLLPRRASGPGWPSSTPTPTAAGSPPDPRFFPNGDDFRGLRVHQTRLQAGDASSDSYCYTS